MMQQSTTAPDSDTLSIPTVFLVTGLSGAGRSTTLHVLEDQGFFCVNNLPPALVPALLALVDGDLPVTRLALGVDVRSTHFLTAAAALVDEFQTSGPTLRVLFLDCQDEVLLQRFSETRRPHPLATQGDVLAAIQRERLHLGELRCRATQVIDTSAMSIHDLKRALLAWVSPPSATSQLTVRLLSFGFKYGVPVDADLLFDVRFLPNPFFAANLRTKTGKDPQVAAFVRTAEGAMATLERISELVNFLLPRYEREGKAYLTVAIGCTGGKHRSVAFVRELASRIHFSGAWVVQDRDIDRG